MLVASVAPLVYTLFDSSNGDVPLYHHYAEKLLSGSLPYRDWVFEYPPYALLFFLFPGAAHGYAGFRALFSLQILALDLVAKVVLLREGDRIAHGDKLGRLVPVLTFSLLVLFQSYFYLKRLDGITGALVVLALVAFARERVATAGALLAVGAGTKLYPALALPALLCLASTGPKRARFVLGTALGVVPMVLLSAFVPWWSFASFQAGRGLQVESTYGSALWLLHFFGLPASWVSRPGCCLEIGGPASGVVVKVARVLFGVVTLGAVGASVAAAWPRRRGAPGERLEGDPGTDSGRVGRVVLLPIVAFMVSSVALSPQFATWLIGPVSLAVGRGRSTSLAAVTLSVILTTFVFPAPGYFTPAGISLARTLVLVARNVALLVALVLLAREVVARLAAPRATPATDGTVLRE